MPAVPKHSISRIFIRNWVFRHNTNCDFWLAKSGRYHHCFWIVWYRLRAEKPLRLPPAKIDLLLRGRVIGSARKSRFVQRYPGSVDYRHWTEWAGTHRLRNRRFVCRNAAAWRTWQRYQPELKLSFVPAYASCIQFGQRSQPEGNAAIYQRAVFPGRNFPREPTASVPLCTRVCRLPFPSAKNISIDILDSIDKEIQEHYSETWRCRAWAKILYQQCILRANLPQKYGQSFKNYLCSYRINEACRQLLYTNKQIGRIAEDVGYKDVDYFLCKFIELKGCTPSHFRKSKTEKPHSEFAGK